MMSSAQNRWQSLAILQFPLAFSAIAVLLLAASSLLLPTYAQPPTIDTTNAASQLQDQSELI
jgi:hypothetical protein